MKYDPSLLPTDQRAALVARLAMLNPTQQLDLLERLGRQPYLYYVVRMKNRRAARYDRDEVLAMRAVSGSTIVGVKSDGVKMVTYRARDGAWFPVTGVRRAIT